MPNKHTLFLVMMLLFSSLSYAQHSMEAVDSIEASIQGIDTGEVYKDAEEMPVFAYDMCKYQPSEEAIVDCAEDALMRYMSAIQYPIYAKENKIEGKVFVRFVVGVRGEIRDIKVIKSDHIILADAAVAHVKKMPRWRPGRSRGENIKVQMTMPVIFKLSEHDKL